MYGQKSFGQMTVRRDAVETLQVYLKVITLFQRVYQKIDAEEIPECDIIIGGFPLSGFFCCQHERRHESDEPQRRFI